MTLSREQLQWGQARMQALGLGLGTYIHELGQSKIVVGHDFRSYSSSIKNALILGLIVAHLVHPGASMHIDPHSLSEAKVVGFEDLGLMLHLTLQNR